MLRAHHHQQQPHQQPHLVALKEEAARAVVRDALQRGHDCIELRRDGKRPIFLCVLCQTRCYNDASLWDHLRGNLHTRHLSGLGFPKSEKHEERSLALKSTYKSPKKELSVTMDVDLTPRGLPHGCMLPLVVVPELRLKLADQGQMFVKVRPCSSSQFVEACWLEKRVLVKQKAGEVEYGVLVFPYGEGLGRGSPLMKSEKVTGEEDMQVVSLVEPAKKSSGRGRKRTKQADRICFICRQKMVAGKDVATLLNMSNKQMMCHSRNWLGAFHVYHTACLVNWILIFDSKFWMGHSLNFSRKYRKNLVSSGHSVTGMQEKPIFCPECQGTGFRLQGGHLEPPRYRLAQIFDWVLELVQARKVWMDHLGPETTGLMFHASKGICHPREFESSLVIPRGTLRFFYTEVDSKLDGMKVDNDGTAAMDIDF